jgi:hypothetical protein
MDQAVLINDFVEGISQKDREFESIPMDKYSLGPWSMSKLKCLQKCPFQFYLKYILKVKVPVEVSGPQDTQLADIGSAAHRILEHVVIGKSVTQSYALTKAEFVPSKLSEEVWVDRVENLEFNIQAFKERIDALGKRHNIKRLFTELRMGVTKDWEPTSFFADNVYFRGIIDLVVQLDNLDIIILDHKTGGGEGSIRAYQDQLDSYKILFHKAKTPVTGAQSGIHFIRQGDVKMSEYTTREDIETKLIANLEWSIEGAIDSVKELGYFKHVRGNQCKYCEYDFLCKPKTLLPLEKSTKRFFEIVTVPVEG